MLPTNLPTSTSTSSSAPRRHAPAAAATGKRRRSRAASTLSISTDRCREQSPSIAARATASGALASGALAVVLSLAAPVSPALAAAPALEPPTIAPAAADASSAVVARAAVAPASAYADAKTAKAAAAIADAFQEHQYYVTGDLTEGLFDDQCAFIDPTTNVVGAAKYAAVVARLFDAAHSKADLLSIGPGSEPSTVVLRWRLEGQLALPGNPPIKAYTGTTRYVLDAATGRVVQQIESWDITALDAFASSFLPPSLWHGAPPAPPVEVLLEQQQQQQQQARGG